MYVQKEQLLVPESDLVEHGILRGFYKVPDLEMVYVSRDGVFWTDRRECFIRPKRSRIRYPCFNDGCEKVLAHIAMAKTFIVMPDSIEKLEVNHRDGDKNNFKLSNLEWVTHRENMFHAYQRGLFPNSKVVLLKELETSQILEFYSLNECGRFLGINASSVSEYLNKPQDSPFRGKYDLIYAGDEWHVFHNHRRPRCGRPRSVLVTKVDTSEMTIYGSATQAAAAIGVDRSEITERANGRRPPIAKGYRFIWLDEYRGMLDGVPVIEYVEPPRTYSPDFRRKQTPVRVTFKSGEARDYPGVRPISEEFGLSASMIQKAARDKTEYRGMRFEYIKATRPSS